MSMYDGNPISELRLIVHSVVFTILFIGLMIVVGFWVYASMSMKNPKEKERLRKLKEKAQSDELAKNNLKSLSAETNADASVRKKTLSQTLLLGVSLFVWASLSWLGASFRGGRTM